MYGRSQSFVASYILDVAFEASKRDHKTFETVGDEDTRWLTAHQDDVAELYVRVGERVSKDPTRVPFVSIQLDSSDS
jgi:hypothetical protein